MSIADETISVSPVPRIQALPNSKFNSRESHDKKNTNMTNFHDNYLKLGLWPELSYTKQAFLRNSFK